jgi:hypothetical protein
MNKSLHIWKHGLLGLVAIAGFGAIVMLLWNWLAPAIFGAAVINFWQALGLLALSKILFGGFGGGFGGRGFGAHGRWDGNRNAIREKWMTMTLEERKDFVNRHHFIKPFAERFNEMFDERFDKTSGGQNTGKTG